MAQGKGNKAKSDNPIAFRFKAETIAHLKDVASFHKRSASNMVAVLIEEAFDKLKTAPRNSERMPALARNKK